MLTIQLPAHEIPQGSKVQLPEASGVAGSYTLLHIVRVRRLTGDVIRMRPAKSTVFLISNDRLHDDVFEIGIDSELVWVREDV